MIPERRPNCTTEHPGLVDRAIERRSAEDVAHERQQKANTIEASKKAKKAAEDRVSRLEHQGNGAARAITSASVTKKARKRIATDEIEVGSFYF